MFYMISGENYRTLILLLICILFSQCKSVQDDTIKFGNDFFEYAVSKDGKNLHFIDLLSGIDYLRKEPEESCAYILKGGKKYDASSVSMSGSNMIIEFEGTDVTVRIRIKKFSDRFTWTVNSINGDPESLTFLNIPLTLEGMPYESFAACALSMNLFTHVRQLQALQTHLWASCYSRFGFKNAEITLIGVPQENILPVIRDVISDAKDIPFSDKGGAWALQQKEGYGSYLMNFGTLTEETVDEWIGMCKNLGFNQIDSHGGGEFFRFGDFELNPGKWPDGWKSFKRINEKLHKAGISSIFHTYAFFIDKTSPYVTPVPSKDLGFFRSFTLAGPLKENDSIITVNESTADITTTTGFFIRNSLSLRIGEELISFTGVTRTPPYKFTGCKRAILGTKAGSFDKGEKIFHLREMFGRFVPGPETGLFNEIAGRTAEIVSDCDFDGIYFDAIDGSDILAGDENFWYYGTKFIFEVAKRLKRPVGMEMSSMSHHWWHYRSRWQAWDRPVRGYKRFIDIHSAAIKSTRLFQSSEIRSNENEHGLWRGHSPLIDKYAGAENGALMLPLHLGWWGNQTWNPPQIEPTFPDDIEYLCCKMMGNNAGLSMLGGADEKTLGENPSFRKLTDIIRQYEELRHQNYFNDTIKAILRQPGKEFSLIKDQAGKWNFKPVSYKKHKVSGISHPDSKWTVNNEFDDQPVKLRIEVLMSVKPYNDPSNIVLTDFAVPDQFTVAGHAERVTAALSRSAEKPAPKITSGKFTGSVEVTDPEEGLWIKMEKRFDPWKDLSENQALGVWVKGDGNGQLLNIRLESPVHLSHGANGDHFIKIDFKGWKYFEMVEIESSEYSNYIWPDSGFYVYDSYRHTLQFNSIDKLQIWYNNLPAGKESCCLISDIKALPVVPSRIADPSVSVNGQMITFKTELESGMYLEFYSADNCKLFGPKGELLEDVKYSGTIPVMKKGENIISVSCRCAQEINPRLQVTVITEGDPL